MSDTEDDGFNEETFKNLDEGGSPVTPPEPSSSPATPSSVAAEPPKVDTKEKSKPVEESKKDEQPVTEPPKKDEKEATTSTDDEKKSEEAPKPPETSAAPAEVVAPQPLTKDDVKSVVSDLLNGERSSSKELETSTKEVLDAYYPEGLSNVLVDEKSGKELRTPADVVVASGNEMSTEEAAQWLMNEQYKLNQQVSKIKDDAKVIAETTLNFKRDAITAVQKYEPLFKAYPVLQQKVYDKMMEQVKVDKDKNVILSAPDVLGHYDFYLEPYQQAYEFATNQSATNPTAPTTPEPPKPTAEDRMDEGGDGGSTPPNDPNDFAQQVNKELAKGI